MAAFDFALSYLQNGTHDLLLPEHINQLARDGGHVFRHTKLTPGNTLRLFIQQIAAGNIACSAVQHLARVEFSDTAWCQARQRLPMELVQQVHLQFVDDTRRELEATNDMGGGEYRWRGHRLYVADGSTDSMPDSPALRSHYGVPCGCREGLGFPMSHLLLLIDHRSGALIDCVDSPMHTSDVSQTPQLHAYLRSGDILLADVAFSGWSHLALISQEKVHAVMPVHHRRTVSFTPQRTHVNPRRGKSSKNVGKPRSLAIKTLGVNDQLVEYPKPIQKPARMSQPQWEALPESITVREIRRTVRRHGFRPITVTIVTTLLDPEQYPADELIDLRLTRWMVELNIRHLKITLGMDVLKCKTVEGVQKERLMFLLVYNLIRRLMLHTARSQGVNVNRLSFADALAWLRWGDIGDLVAIPSFKINPDRPGRLEPRVIKRQKKQFPYMTRPRAQLLSELYTKHNDAA